jgi:hypothetical protein
MKNANKIKRCIALAGLSMLLLSLASCIQTLPMYYPM